MAAALKVLLTDVTTYATIGTAALTAGYAAYRANDSLLKQRDRAQRGAPSISDHFIDENARLLEGSTAVLFPLIASASIIFLFFFLGAVGMILTTLSAFSGFFAIMFVLWPLAEAVVRRLRSFGVSFRGGGFAEAAILSPFVLALILAWLFTGHWILNNIIGVSMCILFAVLCKVPSLKVNTMLFVGLFVYDIFFVFFSKRVFGRNVMVEVATSTPVNPAAAIASLLHLPFKPVENLALPAKLIFPAGENHTSILGLGDIILPEVLLVYLLEIDLKNNVSPLWPGYFGRALIAYVIGLFDSFYFSYTFDAAQPALLYIVPLMIIPVLFIARSRGQLHQLWRGVQRSEDAVSPSQDRNVSESKTEETSALLPQA